MSDNILEGLSKYYQQALLTPELMCLSCAESAWNQSFYCTENRRAQCKLFLNEVAGRLALRPPQATPARPSPPPPRP